MREQRRKLGVTILVLVALVAMISCKTAFQQQSLPGDITNFSGVHVAAPTAIGSATPALMVNSDGLSVLFEVRDAATPVVSVDDGGVLDMKAHAVTNIGAAGTDFSGSGGLTLADALTVTSGGATITAGGLTVTAGGATITAGGLDMTNDAITNIGAAGTDFSATGGLTLADTLTVTSGGATITAGGVTITAGGLDMTDDAITNIGAAGTDFSATGGLTLADTLTVTSGGATVTAGGVTITAGGLDMTDDAITNIGAAGTDFSATGGLTLADTLTVTSGGATITAGGLDMTDDAITNIGAAGTDFSATGGLTLADTLTVSSGGATITAGVLDVNGQKIDLDADADTSITADTDDQIDFEIGGGDVIVLAAAPAVNASGDIVDITATNAGGDGTDTFIGLDMNIASTAGTGSNTTRGIDVSLDTARADQEESAIYLSANWDNDINAATSLELSVDDAVIVTVADPPAVNASGDLVDVTATNAGGDGGEAFVGLDLNLTNTGGSGSNTTRGIEVGLASAQADQDEAGIYFTDNWDADIDAATDLVVAVDSTTILTLMDPQAAGSGGDLLDMTTTFGAMDGSDASIGLDVNLTGADASGTGNTLVGVDLDLTTPDAQAQEIALDVSDADWDYAIDAGSVPVHAVAQEIFLDFWGDELPGEIVLLNGSDAEAVDPAIVANAQYGEMTLVSGDSDTNCAADCSEANLGTVYKANQGGLVFEIRAHIDTTLTNASVCFGFTDLATIEAPASVAGTTITYVADDFVAFCFDDAADTDQWYAIGRTAGTTPATGNGLTGVAPVEDTYQTFRIEVDADGGGARFFIDGSEVGTLTANAVTATDLLAPFISVDTNSTASITVDVDYIWVSAKR